MSAQDYLDLQLLFPRINPKKIEFDLPPSSLRVYVVVMPKRQRELLCVYFSLKYPIFSYISQYGQV